MRIVHRVFGGSEGQARLRGGELDAVDKLGATPIQVIADAENVFAIGGHRDFEAGIEAPRAAAVIVRNQGGPGGTTQTDNRIQRRAYPLRVGKAGEDLPFLQRETVVIRVARLANDAIKCISLGRRYCVSLLPGTVRLGL